MERLESTRCLGSISAHLALAREVSMSTYQNDMIFKLRPPSSSSSTCSVVIRVHSTTEKLTATDNYISKPLNNTLSDHSAALFNKYPTPGLFYGASAC